jgi:hypothetical protein
MPPTDGNWKDLQLLVNTDVPKVSNTVSLLSLEDRNCFVYEAILVGFEVFTRWL